MAAGNGNAPASIATYHDTPDRRLARAGIVLSRRMVNGVGMWETEIAGRVVTARGGPVAVPRALARRLVVPLRHAELVEVARLRTGADDVALLEGSRVVRTYPDLARAIHDAIEPQNVAAPAKTAPAVDHVRAYLARQVAAIERTDPMVRTGDDEEAVHDLRVAIRRSRAVLRTASRLFDPGWVASLRAELKWLAGETAPLRDLDVLLSSIGSGAEADLARVVKELEGEREDARLRLRAALDSGRYFALIDELRLAVEHPPVRNVDASLRKLARAEFERLRCRMDALGARPTDAALHRARISAKRSRYAAELATPVVGKPAEKFVAAAKALQEVAGAHQDGVVAEARIRAAAKQTRSAGAAFAAGRFVERQTTRQKQARSAVPKVWRRLERRGRKAWA